jgi:hypothetical protein
MTPVSPSSSRPLSLASPELLLAAAIARDAAEEMAAEARDASDSARYLRLAERLTTLLGSDQVDRRRLLLASPAVTERSGANRTLLEMIEIAEPDDDAYRLRIARLLLRALAWRPETFPLPGPPA